MVVESRGLEPEPGGVAGWMAGSFRPVDANATAQENGSTGVGRGRWLRRPRRSRRLETREEKESGSKKSLYYVRIRRRVVKGGGRTVVVNRAR